jgi:ADP-ribosylglycohydrolase
VLDPAAILAQVEATRHLDAAAAADELGQACPAEQAIPTILALLQRFAADPETALIENVMAGGDSAARALTLGMILGARHGKDGIPARWREGLTNAPRIEAFLTKLPA